MLRLDKSHILLLALAVVCAAVPTAARDLLVTSYNNSKIFRVDPAGNLSTFAEGSAILSPVDIVFGPDGKVYVSSHGNSRILRFNPDGTPDPAAPGGPGIFASRNELTNVFGLAFGPDGLLYAGSTYYHNIVRFSIDGTYLGVFASGNGLNQPSGLAFGSDRKLYVANIGSSKILRFNSDGSFDCEFATVNLNQPMMITFGRDGKLYVANFRNHNILRFSSEGVYEATVVTNGLWKPFCLAWGPDDGKTYLSGQTFGVYRYNSNWTFDTWLVYQTGANNGIVTPLDGARSIVFFPDEFPRREISDAKRLPDGTKSSFPAAIVSAVFDDCFYIEADDRSSAIRVDEIAHGLSTGMRADVSGTLTTNYDGERCIDASSVSQNGTGSVRSLGMNNRAVGGSDWFYSPDTGAGQRGIAGCAGQNNIGLLVRTWGKVGYVNSSTFTLDDGSGGSIKCITEGVVVDPSWNGLFAAVTGISSCVRFGDDLQRVIRIDDPGRLSFFLQQFFTATDITLSTDHYYNVYDETEAASVRVNLSVKNRNTMSLPVTIDTVVTDYYGDVVHRQAWTGTISPNQSYTGIIAPVIDRKSYYVVTVDVTDRYYRTHTNRLSFGVIKMHPLDTPSDPDDYFGMWGAGSDPNGRTKLAKQVGVQWLREECGWQYREPVKGYLSWGTSDYSLSVAEGLNMSMLFWGENTGPEWALGDAVPGYKLRPLVDLDGWRNFWKLKTTRYYGRVPAYEVWNEVYRLPLDNCVTVHSIALQETRLWDPDAVVIANVTSGAHFYYLQAFLAAGGANACDAIASHPYVYPLSPEAGNMVGLSRQARAEIDKYKPGMPVWWTEWGWPGDDYDQGQPGDYLYGQYVSEREQAHYCVRSHLIGLSEGVRKFSYFHFRSGGSGIQSEAFLRPMGIRPMLCAYNTMTWMINGREYFGQVTPSADIYAMAFQGTDFNVLACWYGGTPETYKRLIVPIGAEDLEIIDMMGNPDALEPVTGGLRIKLDGGPRFVTSSSLDCQTLLTAFQNAVLEN